MTSDESDTSDTRTTALGRLLGTSRFELMPVKGVEDQIATLAPGATVTVTCSPRHGVDRTVMVAELLAEAGVAVIPHLAARSVNGREHLQEIVERLCGVGIDEVFVIGGDAVSPVGAYQDARDLLDDLRTIKHSLRRIGVGGYPEGHPSISASHLLEALKEKQPDAHYLTTQICFDSEVLVSWIRGIRAAGIILPVIVGLPGSVDRRKLAEISLRVGVGTSVRYLTRHGLQIAKLARAPRYEPTALALGVAAHLDDPGLGIIGVHFFTFNQLEATRAWHSRAISGHLRA